MRDAWGEAPEWAEAGDTSPRKPFSQGGSRVQGADVDGLVWGLVLEGEH